MYIFVNTEVLNQIATGVSVIKLTITFGPFGCIFKMHIMVDPTTSGVLQTGSPSKLSYIDHTEINICLLH